MTLPSPALAARDAGAAATPALGITVDLRGYRLGSLNDALRLRPA